MDECSTFNSEKVEQPHFSQIETPPNTLNLMMQTNKTLQSILSKQSSLMSQRQGTESRN